MSVMCSQFPAVKAVGNDYYSFAMLRSASASTVTTPYKFGWNTQERTDEIAGAGNHYTAEFWEYSPRAVMRWNLDPKPNPSISPYAILQGNPIWYTDHKGDTIRVTTSKGTYLFSLDDGKTKLRTMTAKQVYDQGTQWFEPQADNYNAVA